MQIAWRASRPDPDKPVARHEPWLARLAILATGAALLATSSPAGYSYTFSKSVTGPQVELTAAAPSARFLVTARAFELAPNKNPTTDTAEAIAQGAITQSGEAKFVTAHIAGSDGSDASVLTVLTNFRLTKDFTFGGDCKTPAEGVPCQASLLVELARDDGGRAGGSVTVSWSLELQAQVPKADGPNQGPLDLPWTVEITQP